MSGLTVRASWSHVTVAHRAAQSDRASRRAATNWVRSIGTTAAAGAGRFGTRLGSEVTDGRAWTSGSGVHNPVRRASCALSRT